MPHGLARAGQRASGLSLGSFRDERVEDGRCQMRPLEPVGRAECLVAEVATAVSTLVPLYGPRCTESVIMPGLNEVPSLAVAAMEVTAGVGAERRMRRLGDRFHALRHGRL